MRKILKKSTIVLVMLIFILAMVNVNGVNTSFADTKDSTQTTTTPTENNQSDSSSSDETSSTDEDSTEDDENVLKTDDGFKYTVEDDEVTIKGYEGSKTTLTIPSEIDGKKVTKIGANAFDSNTSITSVEIPDSVTTIDSYAFYNATALESVSIPESVTTMNEGAFANCTALSTVNLPSKLKTISYGLFASCSNLTKIEIPEGVTSIDGYAFYTCTSLKEINIPEKVASIGEAAFYYCAALESIEIPKSVEDIGSYAFDSCSNLTMSGYSSSAAKTYASENSIPFKTIRTALDYAKIVLVFVALGAIIYLIHKLKAIVKHKKYLKNNIDFEENIVLIDNEICKVEFTGKSKLKLVNGKEVQNKKKTLGTEFVGYKYNIENKSDSNIEVYIKYATVGDYTDKFNLDEQIPKGKKAKGFACLQKTNSLDNLKSVSGTIVVCNEKNNEVKVKSYDFKVD